MDNKYEELLREINKSGENFIGALRTTANNPMIINSKLIICGMGGSGISGDYIKYFSKIHSDKEITVNKKYEIPKSVDYNYDAIVISYSGNTEETLSCLNQLLELDINPVCVTSGGKLAEIAEQHELRVINIPKGIQPRAAFPYLLGSVYGLVATTLNFPIPDISEENNILKSSNFTENNDLIVQLRNYATSITKSIPIILSPWQKSFIAKRFRCQLNENAKLLATDFVVPEFNHNGIVAFDGSNSKEQIIILIRSNNEFTRTSIQLNYLRDNLGNKIDGVIEFNEQIDNELEEILTLTWKLDYISIIAAKIQNIDPIAVPSIDKLKQKLKSIND